MQIRVRKADSLLNFKNFHLNSMWLMNELNSRRSSQVNHLDIKRRSQAILSSQTLVFQCQVLHQTPCKRLTLQPHQEQTQTKILHSSQSLEILSHQWNSTNLKEEELTHLESHLIQILSDDNPLWEEFLLTASIEEVKNQRNLRTESWMLILDVIPSFQLITVRILHRLVRKRTTKSMVLHIQQVIRQSFLMDIK